MNINLINKYEYNNYDGVIIGINKNTTNLIGISLPFKKLIDSKSIKYDQGKTFKFTSATENNITEVVLVGIGDEDITYREMLNSFADAFRQFSENKISKIAVDLTYLQENELIIKSVIESIIMAEYKFDTYLSEKEDKDPLILDIVIKSSEKYSSTIKEAKSLAISNLIARQLVNEPSNIMSPDLLSKKTIELGKDYGFEVEVLEKKTIKELKMDSYLAVSKGSDFEPKFIIMRYKGDPDNKEVLGFVGKGLTYDSGGLSIKPTSSMVTMKSDMAGAAAVIGSMCAISSSGLKTNVTAVIAACENMISGKSYRPGDILNSMGGKSIFIGNTDAEGRLTLIDAMHYIIKHEAVTKVLDIATLTGAAIHCTGDVAAPVISSNDDFFNELNNAYKLSGELIWRMPIFNEYKELIKHEQADLTNTAGSPGTITAGLFIGEFTGKLPWVHIDIAGPSMAKKSKGINSVGGTGCGVRPLYYLAKNSQRSE